MEYKFFWIFVIFYTALQKISSIRSSSPLKRPKAGDPFDTFPKNFWQEFSSPFTDTPDDNELEIIETTTHEPFPFFADSYTTVNVSTQLATNVHLHCRVNDLQGKTVSWMRRKGDELTLITFGRHTYSGDSRYTLEFEEPNDWKLLIQYANERDEGPYECQVSSHPPLVLLVYLTVIVPHVEILDERGSATPEKYYKAGSTIELQCVISKIPQPSSYIMWRHSERLLNYDTSRGGISVKTDMLPGRALSRLYIANANRQDSGNYTCMLGNDITGTVLVHVLNGEEPAAMQHAGGNKLQASLHTILLAYTMVVLLIALWQLRTQNATTILASRAAATTTTTTTTTPPPPPPATSTPFKRATITIVTITPSTAKMATTTTTTVTAPTSATTNAASEMSKAMLNATCRTQSSVSSEHR